MNRVQIIGRLTSDCQLKNVNGKSVLNMNVAVNNSYKDYQGNKIDNVSYFSCSYWTDRTAVAEYLKKGTSVFLEGTPEASLYTNKNGQTIPQLKVRVSYLKLLSKGNGGGTQQQNENANDITEPIDGLPF